MEKEFNNYPALEKKYGEEAFEIWKKDQDLVDKIIERQRNLSKVWNELNKRGKRQNGR